jgi:hypothetical protein
MNRPEILGCDSMAVCIRWAATISTWEAANSLPFVPSSFFPSPTPPQASCVIMLISPWVQEPSSLALPSHVAERTKRFGRVMFFRVVVSKTLDIDYSFSRLAMYLAASIPLAEA